MRPWACIALSILPCPALAEGARLALDCGIVSVCDIDGICEEAEGDVRIAVEPEDIGDDGLGLYTLWLGDGDAVQARGLSRTGPFAWSMTDDDAPVAATLLLTGETSAVWLRRGADGTAVDFLTCEIVY